MSDGIVTAHTPVRRGKPIEPVGVPVQIVDGGTGMRMRQSVFNLASGDEIVVEVSCGAGLGGDFVELEYLHSDGEKRLGVFYLKDVAADWITAIDSDVPGGLLEAVRGGVR